MTDAAAGRGHEAPSIRCAHMLVDSVWGVRVVGVARKVDDDLRCACVHVCVRRGRVGKMRDCRAQLHRRAYIGPSAVFRARAKQRDTSHALSRTKMYGIVHNIVRDRVENA